MPFQNVQILQRAQAKIEGTRGTPETTMTRWWYFPPGALTWQYLQELEEVSETTRTFAATVDRQLGIRFVRINIEINLTFEEVVWWLNCILDGSNLTGTTTGSTPPGYTYSLAPNVTTDDLASFSLKAGNPGNPYKFSRCAVNRATFRWNPMAGGEVCWRMQAEIWAIFDGTTTFDSPSDLTRTKVLAKGTKVYRDDTTLGSTQVQNSIRSGSFTINNNLEEKVWSESTVSPHTDFARGEQVVTGEIVEEHQNDTEFAKMRAGTIRKIRLLQEGAQIGVTPTTLYKWQVDFPNAKLMAPTFGYAGQNEIVTWPFVAQWTSAATQVILVAVVNAAATITA